MDGDSNQKHVEIRVVIGGSPKVPHVVLDGVSLLVGNALPPGYGFDDCVLDERLFRILCALALRRLDDPGWMSADELALVAEGNASGGGVAKFLERRLTDMAVLGRVIEFEPRARDTAEGRARGHHCGRSRGPYRIGPSGKNLVIDQNGCWDTLFRQLVHSSVLILGSAEEHMIQARELVDVGQFSAARQHAEAAVVRVLKGNEPGSRKASDRTWLLARAYDLLSNVEMEMGLWDEGLVAAARAKQLFAQLHHPEGEAHAMLIQAHLLGQRGFRGDALSALSRARAALRKLDSASKQKRYGVARAECVVVAGQRMSRMGDNDGAAKALEWALRAYLKGGVDRGVCLAHVRLAQNSREAGEIAVAEQSLVEAHALHEHLTPAGRALLARVSAEVFVAAGRWAEAERWAANAVLLGNQQSMRNQLCRMRPILAALERRHSSPGNSTRWRFE